MEGKNKNAIASKSHRMDGRKQSNRMSMGEGLCWPRKIRFCPQLFAFSKLRPVSIM
jgi:hypothetical protein